jgi:membrane-bound inhibitor of C-type lysozyme
MMSSKTGLSILALSFALSACSTRWLPWARSDQEQPRRLPEGAVEYQCAQDKALLVRHAADGKSVWVFFPDREFRLDQSAAGGAKRYSNGPTTMTVEADVVGLDVDGARQYADCKRKPK